jgi:hypothetical protein
MKCISRITDEAYVQCFGNNRNKFYLEFCCGRPCINGLDLCAKCCEKSKTCVQQHSRRFDHGKVNEPIPDNSHIFGGKWYVDGVRKWGSPSIDIIEFALQHQKQARGDFVVIQPEYTQSSKDNLLNNTQEMSKSKKISVENKIQQSNIDGVISSNIITEDVKAPKKRGRKPKVVSAEEQNNSVEKVKPKKSKASVTPYNKLIQNTNQIVHKEVTIPTHLETTLDEFDTDGYEIEYVKLTPIDIEGVSYFIDKTKYKVYSKIKNKIGIYVGRLHPDNNTIISDVPDSDDEND